MAFTPQCTILLADHLRADALSHGATDAQVALVHAAAPKFGVYLFTRCLGHGGSFTAFMEALGDPGVEIHGYTLLIGLGATHEEATLLIKAGLSVAHPITTCARVIRALHRLAPSSPPLPESAELLVAMLSTLDDPPAEEDDLVAVTLGMLAPSQPSIPASP